MASLNDFGFSPESVPPSTGSAFEIPSIDIPFAGNFQFPDSSLMDHVLNNSLGSFANASILHSAYRGYKESVAEGNGRMKSFFLGGGIGGIQGTTRTYLTYLLAGAAGLGSGGALAVGAGVNEVFNGLSKSREANMRLDKMRTVVRLPGISHVRDFTRNGLKSMLGENLGEKIFPREHFGAGKVGRSSITERNKEEFLQSKGVKNFISAIHITQSQAQKKIPILDAKGNDTGKKELPFQNLRDALSAYIPGYDQDDITETEPEKILEQILQTAGTTKGGLLVGKSKKEVLEAIEKFGERITIFPNSTHLLSKAKKGRAPLYAPLFNNKDYRALLNTIWYKPEAKPARHALRDIILSHNLTIDGKKYTKKEIDTALKSDLLNFLQKIPAGGPGSASNNTRKEILESFFQGQRGGVLNDLITAEYAQSGGGVDLNAVPASHGEYRAFNEIHDTALGGKKGGALAKMAENLSIMLNGKKTVRNSDGKIEEKDINRLGGLLNIASLILATREVVDLTGILKNKKLST